MIDFLKRRHIHDELHYWLKSIAQRITIKPPIRFKSLFLFLASVLVSGVVVYALLGEDLPREAVFMSGILVLAALLWVTEALPLFATALLVMALEIILLANPGAWEGLGFSEGVSPDYRTFLAPLSDPILVLFLGGFLMAQAAIKEGVDKALAGVILRFFGGKPVVVLLGLMVVTAVFSMWMSNTATTAMMITLVVPMVAQLPQEDRFRKALLLSIPFAANIGGMGTPIASPPNAVAVGFLLKEGYTVTFLEWMLVATPLMVGLLLVSWLLLWAFFPLKTKDLRFEPPKSQVDRRGWFVLIVIAVTILLWLTDKAHGLPTGVVALLPAIAFTATGLLGRREFNTLEWHILILIAGGIALGVGMSQTGLDQYLVEALPTDGGYVLMALALAALVFSTFMSNTAAANLILPIGISLATALSIGGGPNALQLGMSIALAASVAMALPISTPPNAIAYAHGELETRDMALVGSLIGVLAVLLILAFGSPIIDFWTGG